MPAAGIEGAAAEDGDSFAANALSKALYVYERSGKAAIADDSGLVVDALGGAPGIHSARYAGCGASDSDNINKLLRELYNIPEGQRQARFVCAIALIDSSGRVHSAQGSLEGRIALRPKARLALAMTRCSSQKTALMAEAWPSCQLRRKTPSHTAPALSARFVAN
jgi:non-canonical purine NTP pyrophosphatase (RdgB/HAM1 family)